MRTFPEIKMARRRRKKVSRTSQSLQELKATNRSKELCQRNEDSMRRTYEVVTTKKMGVIRAALEFDVPRTTLKDRVSLRVMIFNFLKEICHRLHTTISILFNLVQYIIP